MEVVEKIDPKKDHWENNELTIDDVTHQMSQLLRELRENLANLDWGEVESNSPKYINSPKPKNPSKPKKPKPVNMPIINSVLKEINNTVTKPLNNKVPKPENNNVPKPEDNDIPKPENDNVPKPQNNNNIPGPTCKFKRIRNERLGSRDSSRSSSKDSRIRSRSRSGSGRRTPVVINNVANTQQPKLNPKSPTKSIAHIAKRFSIPIVKQVTSDTLQPFKEIVDRAIRDRKTFTVCGGYNAIRRSLHDRGWVERIRINFHSADRNNIRHLHNFSISELLHGINDEERGLLYRRIILSKLLGTHQVDFYWDDINDAFKVNNDKIKYTLINRFRRTMFSYTTKQGLCEAIKMAHWYQKPGTSNIRHPRSYSLSNKGDPQEFMEDYKVTAAMSLLKWIVHTKKKGKLKIISASGRIGISTFHFAMEECSKQIKKAKHEDIDYEIEEAEDYEWNDFLDKYYKIVHLGNHFKQEEGESEDSVVAKAEYLLNEMGRYFPHLEMDGMMNIWLLKPIAGSRGLGIHICRTLECILKIVKANISMRYVIQKYIEKPLLIFNTKFDIRQWFLISSSVPLTIWVYKECYLRFSSQTYNLRKLHESIHLTNNSVQSKYKNDTRDDCIPPYNMWDTKEFKSYLSNIGYPNVFNKIIYPGMKECIVGTILLNQCNLDQRKNSFELYGADFMLTEDFMPWLIEINSKPALAPTTPVTARMCPKVLEDLVKVMIDYPKNPKANTGNFQLVYRQRIPKLPIVDTTKLVLEGTPLPIDYFSKPDGVNPDVVASETKPSHQMSKEIMKITEAHQHITQVSSEMKKALKNLLNIIANERKRRRQLNAQNKNVKAQSASNVKEQKVSQTSNEVLTKQAKKSENSLNQGDNKANVIQIKEIFSAKLCEPITPDETKMIENLLDELNEPQIVTDVVDLLQNEIKSEIKPNEQT